MYTASTRSVYTGRGHYRFEKRTQHARKPAILWIISSVFNETRGSRDSTLRKPPTNVLYESFANRAIGGLIAIPSNDSCHGFSLYSLPALYSCFERVERRPRIRANCSPRFLSLLYLSRVLHRWLASPLNDKLALALASPTRKEREYEVIHPRFIYPFFFFFFGSDYLYRFVNWTYRFDALGSIW